MKKHLLLTVCGLFIISIQGKAQDLYRSFTSTDLNGNNITIDSITATNLTSGDIVKLAGTETLVLKSSTTGFNDISTEMKLSAIPNPFENYTTLSFSLEKEEHVLIRLLTVSGKVAVSFRNNLTPANYKFKVSGPKAGMYILNISTGSFNRSLKIIQKDYGTAEIKNIRTSSLSNPESKPLKAVELVPTLAFSDGDTIHYTLKNKLNSYIDTTTEIVTSASDPEVLISGTFEICFDHEGNWYKIVKIGSQIWIADNLRATKFPNGTDIPLVTDNKAWKSLGDNDKDKAYCWYNNDKNYAFAKNYGALYTYAAATNGDNSGSNVQGICPDGWHLPSESEWGVLEAYVKNDGYDGEEATALKSKTGWNMGNGLDIYGFSALPNGYRKPNEGYFTAAGVHGTMWTSTEVDNSNERAFHKAMDANYKTIFEYGDVKSGGFGVRCVKD